MDQDSYVGTGSQPGGVARHTRYQFAPPPDADGEKVVTCRDCVAYAGRLLKWYLAVHRAIIDGKSLKWQTLTDYNLAREAGGQKPLYPQGMDESLVAQANGGRPDLK